ncbi:MAG: glycosyltransferase family 39 protein [Candidatus Omnitrophica bacterium]|nr:glycosyltransferase family 39 protein [Candidatus Omnitrophota bacterium]
MEKLSHRKILLILFFGSLLLRIIFILTLENRFYFDDEFEYARVAENFLAGRGLMAGEGIKGFRPPLYPLMLSLFYSLHLNLIAIRIIQCIISAFTVCLVYIAGKKIFSEKIGLWSGIITAVYPFFIFYNGFLLTETLFIFLTLAAIYYFVSLTEKSFSSARAGVMLGLAGLCRPIMQIYLPISFMHIIAGKERLKEKLKKILLIAVFFIMTVSPWVTRNYAVFKKFVPGTTMGGWVFWEGNNPYSVGGPCRYFPEGIGDVEETERDKLLFRMTADVIRENPGRFAWLLQNKFKRFWNVVPNAAEFTKPLYRFISVMSFGVMLPFFVLGFFLSLRNKKAQFIHSLIIFFTVFHMIFLASIRYRVPLETFYIMFAVYGLFRLAEKIKSVIKGAVI